MLEHSHTRAKDEEYAAEPGPPEERMDFSEGVDLCAPEERMDVAEDVDPFGEVGMIGYFPNAGGEVTPPAVGLGEATPPYQPVCRVQTPPPSPLPVMAGEVVHPVDADCDWASYRS